MRILQTMHLLHLTIAAMLLFTVGCSDNDKPSEELTEKEIYTMARKQIDANNYTAAVTNLQLLESRFPFGPYAEQAQLELIFAHYRSYDNDAAVASADRFIRLHPQHPSVDYAYYMKGLANFTEGKGLFERFLPTDLAQRDPGAARQSFNDFAQLLARYPESDYAADAQARMLYLRNLLARHEIVVANYYFKRGAYVAAANRGRYVVENFQKTPAVPDGLAIMVQAYLLLGTQELADDSLAILKSNFPDHPSLDRNGNFITKFTLEGVERSWINKLSLGLFDRTEPPKFDNRAEWEL
jgi:outer membrane protein assembly factor BamD